MTDQRCESCKWSIKRALPAWDTANNLDHLCQWWVKNQPRVEPSPYGLDGAGGVWVEGGQGTDCPTWAAKDNTAKKEAA